MIETHNYTKCAVIHVYSTYTCICTCTCMYVALYSLHCTTTLLNSPIFQLHSVLYAWVIYVHLHVLYLPLFVCSASQELNELISTALKGPLRFIKVSIANGESRGILGHVEEVVSHVLVTIYPKVTSSILKCRQCS